MTTITTRHNFRVQGITIPIAIVETYQRGKTTRHTLKCNDVVSQHPNIAAAKKALARKVGFTYKLLEQSKSVFTQPNT